MSRYSDNSRRYEHRLLYRRSEHYSRRHSHRTRYDEDRPRRRNHEAQSPKRHAPSFPRSFDTNRTVVEVENNNVPTCKVSSCLWTGFDDELLSHCIRNNHRILESDEEDIIRIPNWKPTDTYKNILLKFRSLLVWLSTEIVDCRLDVVLQYAAVDGIHKPFRYHVGLGTKKQERRAEFCKIAPSTVLCAEDLFAKYKTSLKYKTLATMGHLSLMFTITPDDDRTVQPSYETRYFFGCDDFRREANNALREKFTCPVCLNYIRKEARFCPHEHAVCHACFPKLKECPMCRSEYGKDFKNEEAEILLSLLHFPEPTDEEF